MFLFISVEILDSSQLNSQSQMFTFVFHFLPLISYNIVQITLSWFESLVLLFSHDISI